MKSLCVIGANGLLGGELVAFLKNFYEVTGIDLENYASLVGGSFDVLVNANGNSRRFWANRNVLDDFTASTISVYKTLFDFKFKKYIYISSSDVYRDHSSPLTTEENQRIEAKAICPYGFHKYLGEVIVSSRTEDYLILRFSMILGRRLKKGPIFDVLNNQPLFVSLDAEIQMITGWKLAAVIKLLLEKGITGEIFNVGGRGVVAFLELAGLLGRPVVARPDAEEQKYQMNVTKLGALFPLKTSQQYLKEFLEKIKMSGT